MSYSAIKKESNNKKITYIIGELIGVFTTLGAMLAFAAFMLFFNIDRSYATPFATISVAVGGFVASYYISKKIRDKGYLVGIVTGATIFIVITLLSIILGNSVTVNTLFHLVIILLSSIVGGIIGVNISAHKKYI